MQKYTGFHVRFLELFSKIQSHKYIYIIYIHTYIHIYIYIYIYIKTHGSESRGQEEAGLHDEPVSYLQVALL